MSKPRGFTAMDPDMQKKIALKGAKTPRKGGLYATGEFKSNPAKTQSNTTNGLKKFNDHMTTKDTIEEILDEVYRQGLADGHSRPPDKWPTLVPLGPQYTFAFQTLIDQKVKDAHLDELKWVFANIPYDDGRLTEERLKRRISELNKGSDKDE